MDPILVFLNDVRRISKLSVMSNERNIKVKQAIVITIIIVLCVITAIASVRQNILYDDTVKILESMRPSQVTTFKIYPQVDRPVGNAIEFAISDPIVEDFFEFVSDIHAYSPDHDTVVSWNHSWFLEVSRNSVVLQVRFLIPSGKGKLVTGEIGQYRKGKSVFYGHFQSQQLYDWYQKYSHRWLTPEDDRASE